MSPTIYIFALVVVNCQSIPFNPCTCPCTDIVPIEVTPYLNTNANCVYIRSIYSRGFLFTADKVVEGNRYVYHDVSHYQNPNPNYSHTAFWKIYYPWKNVSDTADVPLAVENILSSEYLVVTGKIVQSTNREIVTFPVLTKYSLWYFSYFQHEGYYKLKNHYTKEFLFSDELHTSGFGEGKVFTDTTKLDSSADFPGKYGFAVIPCYE
ncbi:uncharacterized protein LOC134216504 [Armigeres subalbatus]|uniref:uncharacterized protein LOC134216504 n=1 Tax=Armigeres subalbatus TaxID=124917 RepID=UPI002ED1D105